MFIDLTEYQNNCSKKEKKHSIKVMLLFKSNNQLNYINEKSNFKLCIKYNLRRWLNF